MPGERTAGRAPVREDAKPDVLLGSSVGFAVHAEKVLSNICTIGEMLRLESVSFSRLSVVVASALCHTIRMTIKYMKVMFSHLSYGNPTGRQMMSFIIESYN